jgi:CheY-like chemotaxis protein
VADTGPRVVRMENAIAELKRESGEGAKPAVEALAFEVHNLRGTAATIALHSIAASATDVELDIGRWNADDPETQRALAVSATHLLELVRAVASRHTGAGEGTVVRLPREGDGPVVLHVEDNAFNLKLVERVLEQRPEIRLAEARTGAAGLALARDLVPSLILLDLRLPDIPGDSVLRLLREDVMTREIPVVMISAEARPVEADRLLAAGANEFLVKPIDIRTLLDVVDRILARAKP